MATARPLDIKKLVLRSGAHDKRSLNGLCFMEAAAWLAGRDHSDHPECVSPIIGAFMRRWNDDLDDAGRQRLKPLLSLVLNTVASPEVEDRRGWMCADWMGARPHANLAPTGWSERSGCCARGALPEIADVPALKAATAGPLETARQKAAAAWAAARDAATKKLEPTKLSLQDSALELVRRMCKIR